MLRFTRGFLLCRLTLRVHTAVPLSVSSITRLPGGLGEVFRNLNESKKDAFHPGRVKQVHLYDNMDRDSWVLVYRDVNSSKHFYFAALLLPPIICGFLVLAVDILWNDVHFGFTQKLLNDADELGALAVIPLFLTVVVFVTLWRIQSSRLLRIYQKVSDPKKFVAVSSRMVILQKKTPFVKGEAQLRNFDSQTYDSMGKFFRNIFKGTVAIKGSGFLHDDECFISNNARSFMLNEFDKLTHGNGVKRRNNYKN
ncbi:unnamed protein product [Enterobius vermicularis]|uniref:BPH_2 domain-containing protein n=1 Tax=Enterobius vermicularis TaxID=51028 RepID=A0A0N4VBV8_ENTVE|nr:unnamed protein product [Enterobius vermicularis]